MTPKQIRAGIREAGRVYDDRDAARGLAGIERLRGTDVSGSSPPTEFRVFKAGANPNRNGAPAIFDDEAARAVMADYEAHGADGMVDLEHLSLDDEGRHYDPDARAWYRLELRAGELWAVDVRWTPDGEARLREKRQRYISPAFKRDPKSNRVVRLINIGLTALPASDDLTPLVAARQQGAASDEACDEEHLENKMPINPRLLALLGLPAGTDAAGCAAAFAAMSPEDQAKIWAAMSAAEDEDDTEENKVTPPPPPPPAVDPKAAPAHAAPPVATSVVVHRQDTTSAALAAEVVKLRQEANARELRDVLNDAKALNKTTPALEKWSLAAHADSPAAAREFWNAVAAGPAPAGPKQAPGMPVRGKDGDVTKLNQREEGTIRSIAKRMGNDPDEAVKFRISQIAETTSTANAAYQRDLDALKQEYDMGDEVAS